MIGGQEIQTNLNPSPYQTLILFTVWVENEIFTFCGKKSRTKPLENQSWYASEDVLLISVHQSISVTSNAAQGI